MCFPSEQPHGADLNCAAFSLLGSTARVCVEECCARDVALKMAWCGGVGDSMRGILCRSLEALLQRDRSFAQSFVKDRRALQRVVKLILAQETDATQLQPYSRLERSAGLHCIVLALRLAHIDEFAAEVSLPILIAGSLSGVVQYLPGCQHEGKESQQNPQDARPDEKFSNPKKMSGDHKFWPSTPLSSAQELAAHAVVNPLVLGCAYGNSIAVLDI